MLNNGWNLPFVLISIVTSYASIGALFGNRLGIKSLTWLMLPNNFVVHELK